MQQDGLGDLDGRAFDVLIIGGGISGASAAQHLSAAGYSVLLAEKGDYGGAATSRSGRLLHCGLRYLGPAYSLWDFARDPRRLVKAVSAARRSIRSSTEFVRDSPHRQRTMTIHTTIGRDMPYRGRHVDLGARFLSLLGSGRQDIGYRRFRMPGAAHLPFIGWLRDTSRLTDVIRIEDRQFHWPERICVDAVMAARRNGAVARNYTSAGEIRRLPDGCWEVRLTEAGGGGDTAAVRGRVLLNMTGAWIDEVNARAARGAGKGAVPRQIVAVKGVHVLVRLPDALRGQGFMGLNRHGEGLTVLPWGEMHFVGPTETLYDGDLDDVVPDEADIREILDEVNHLLPGIGLTRGDVRQAWAGVRPITYGAGFPKGDRMAFSRFRDLGGDGLENVFTLTWAAIMFHRPAAREVLRHVRRRIRPSGPPRPLDFAPPARSPAASPRLIEDLPDLTLADVVHAVEHEQARSLVDILFRRLPLGWYRSIPPETVERVAETAGAVLGWPADRRREEVRRYDDYVRRYHLDDRRTPWKAV